jgi:hypothetical protein
MNTEYADPGARSPYGLTERSDSPRLAAIAAARSSGGSSQAAGYLLKRVVVRRGWPPAEAVAVRLRSSSA